MVLTTKNILYGIVVTGTLACTTAFAGVLACKTLYQPCSTNADCCSADHLSCNLMHLPSGQNKKICTPRGGLANGQKWSGSFTRKGPRPAFNQHSHITVAYEGIDGSGELKFSYKGEDCLNNGNTRHNLCMSTNGDLSGSAASGSCTKIIYDDSGHPLEARNCTYNMPDSNTLIISTLLYKATLHLQTSRDSGSN